MAPEPTPSRGMPRSLLYALIPAGFLVMVVLMMTFGRTDEEDAQIAPPAQVEGVELPPQADGAAVEKTN